jgi:peptide/nickel transport system ATP-binding protein
MSKHVPILELHHLSVRYGIGKNRTVHAVADIDLQMARGETLGLVGESGCGKSSMARAIIQLPGPSAGKVLFNGEDLTQLKGKRLRQIRPRLQMIFQDSIAALNPRREVGKSIAMPLSVMRQGSPGERLAQARKMMSAVGLDPVLYERRPFQFSGGQCQRLQIARALMSRPDLLICDEPVASLDVSIQAQILNLLESMRRKFKLTLLFISHDMAVVKNVCDRIAVMYLGKICETAPTEILFQRPAHPYTAALIRAIPSPSAARPHTRTKTMTTEVPSPLNPPAGCRFHTRCPSARRRCTISEPRLVDTGAHRQVACHYPQQDTTIQ